MKDTNFYVVHGWMLNRLKLRGSSLLIYAIIHGFSQDGVSEFCGTAEYLGRAAGITTRQVYNLLGELSEKGLLSRRQVVNEKAETGKHKKVYNYRTVPLKKTPDRGESAGGQENTSEEIPEELKKIPESCEIFSEKSSHHNNSPDSDLDNKEFHPKKKIAPPAFTTAEAVDHEAIEPPVHIPKTPPLLPGFPELIEVKDLPVKRKTSNGKIELTQEQLMLFHKARERFEQNEKAKALIYQDRGTASREMQNLKLFILRCGTLSPEYSEEFLMAVLDHFQVIVNSKLKGKAAFTPRSLMTPWIWELVIESLPEKYDETIEQIVKGLFK